MDYLINVANILYVLAYVVRDMLVLRILTLFAASFLVLYFYFLPEPLMVAIYWNLFFLTINAFWVTRLALDRISATSQLRNKE